MAISAVRELFVDVESTFSVDPSSNGSGYAKIPAEDVSASLSRETIERPIVRSALGKSITSVPGQKGGTVSFSVSAVGAATPGVASTQAAIDPWLSALLASCGLVEVPGTGTTVSGGSSTTTTVDVVSNAGFSVGSLVMISGEVRLVTALPTGQVTVTPALSAAPANGVVVHGGSLWMLNDTDYTPDTVALVHKRMDVVETLLGCAGTLTVDTVEAAARVMLSFEMQVNSYNDASDTAKLSLPGDFTVRAPCLAMGSPVYWGATKTAVARVGFDPALALSPRATTEGIQGRDGWRITGEESVLTMTPYAAQDTYWADHDAQTKRVAIAQVGTAAGNVFAMCVPGGQIRDLPGEADVNGIVGHDLTIRARESSVANGPHFLIAFF